LHRELGGLLTSYATFKAMALTQMQEASGGYVSVGAFNKAGAGWHALADTQTLPPR